MSAVVRRLSRHLQFCALCCLWHERQTGYHWEWSQLLVIFTLKPVDQTFVAPHSTDNRSINISNTKERVAPHSQTSWIEGWKYENAATSASTTRLPLLKDSYFTNKCTSVAMCWLHRTNWPWRIKRHCLVTQTFWRLSEANSCKGLETT